MVMDSEQIKEMGLSAVTVTDQQFTDKDQAGIYFGLADLDRSIKELQTAGMMGKADKAEKTVLNIRETLGKLASANHALFNEVTRLRGELDHIRKNGFGG